MLFVRLQASLSHEPVVGTGSEIVGGYDRNSFPANNSAWLIPDGNGTGTGDNGQELFGDFRRRLTMLRMRSRFLLACVFVSVLAWHGPSADSQSRALSEEFRLHQNFQSKFLKKHRNVIVWLPPGYHSEPAKRYPVLYMHDGGTVFILWRIDEIAKPLITSGQVEPLIIVLVNHGGTEDDRFDEYTPTKPPNFKSGGKADSYGRMLVEELKPFIDSQYRTLTDPANTGLSGVSLGGIVSLHLGLEYPMVFGKLAVMSPSVWWDNKVIVRNVKDLKTKPALRIWLDIGTGEGQRAVDDAKELRNAFVKKGWVLNSDLIYFEAKGSGHNEEAFAQRAEPMLKHLFPKQANRE